MCPGFGVDLPPRVLASVGEGTSLAAVHPDCREFRLLQEPPFFAALCSGVLVAVAERTGEQSCVRAGGYC